MSFIKNFALPSLFALISANAFAARSPYLPSQGDLVATANCSGISIHPGDSVRVQANARGVMIQTTSQTVVLGASNFPVNPDVAAIGSFGGLMPGLMMPFREPVLINGELVYNTFWSIGGGGGVQIMPVGLLVDSHFRLENPRITDTGHSLVLTATKTDSTSPSFAENVECELE